MIKKFKCVAARFIYACEALKISHSCFAVNWNSCFEVKHRYFELKAHLCNTSVHINQYLCKLDFRLAELKTLEKSSLVFQTKTCFEMGDFYNSSFFCRKKIQVTKLARTTFRFISNFKDFTVFSLTADPYVCMHACIKIFIEDNGMAQNTCHYTHLFTYDFWVCNEKWYVTQNT
jgi:hypothetical protein